MIPGTKRTRMTVAISPCPNDTFIFGGWVMGQIAGIDDLDVRFVWKDVEELNRMAEMGQAQVVKVSAAQALLLRHRYSILNAGGAFGFGQGPRLLSRPGAPFPPATVAVQESTPSPTVTVPVGVPAPPGTAATV